MLEKDKLDFVPRAAPLRFSAAELQGELLRLCHQGALEGGLSVALDVRPDELVGPLTYALGGTATRLKVFDARGDSPMELVVSFEGTSERWELEGIDALVHNLNDLYRTDPEVKTAAVLGDFEDMRQLWCLGKKPLGRLLREPFFEPLNRRQLEQIASGPADGWTG
ncbi:MAG: hypothetical protein HYZ28_20150 [Myxococcales bacterium]|nr:hypothetical protein [Myxococcales bacterium]